MNNIDQFIATCESCMIPNEIAEEGIMNNLFTKRKILFYLDFYNSSGSLNGKTQKGTNIFIASDTQYCATLDGLNVYGAKIDPNKKEILYTPLYFKREFKPILYKIDIQAKTFEIVKSNITATQGQKYRCDNYIVSYTEIKKFNSMQDCAKSIGYTIKSKNVANNDRKTAIATASKLLSEKLSKLKWPSGWNYGKSSDKEAISNFISGDDNEIEFYSLDCPTYDNWTTEDSAFSKELNKIFKDITTELEKLHIKGKVLDDWDKSEGFIYLTIND